QHGDVVAARGLGDARVGGRARVAAAVRALTGEEHREADDRRLVRGLARHLDDGDAVVRRLAVGVGGARRVRRHVDVDVLALGYQGVGVGAAGGLDGGDVARVPLVADVEDLHALPGGLLGGRLGGAVATAVAARGVGGQEQQVAGDGDVVLRAGAQELGDRLRRSRVADVEDAEAVVVPGEGVPALEGQVRIGPGQRVLGDVGHVPHVAGVGDLVLAGYLALLDGRAGFGTVALRHLFRGGRPVPGAGDRGGRGGGQECGQQSAGRRGNGEASATGSGSG